MTPSHPVGVVLHGSLLEILIHRSHLYDDEKGLDEVPLDTATAKVRFYFERLSSNPQARRGSVEIDARRRGRLNGIIVMKKSAEIAPSGSQTNDAHKIAKWFVFEV